MPEPPVSCASSAVRVLLADDHEILRQGLKLLLSLQPEIDVVGEARTGRETVTQTLQLLPEVVVLDISMPDMDGLEACRQIRLQAPATGVLVLTMHESEDYFLQALRAGAAGYLVKRAAPPDLQMAILAVARGGVFLAPGLAPVLLKASARTPSAASEDLAGQLRALSRRELEVLTLVARGYTNREIAEQLVLSVKTVQAHRASAMTRLGLENVTHLVRFAMRSGLLPSDI